MLTPSKMGAWRAAEADLAMASRVFSRNVFEDLDQSGFDDAQVALQTARRHALQTMHTAVEDCLFQLSGGLWTAWRRRLIDFERRILDSSRRVSSLESCLGVAPPGSAAATTDDAALRSEEHLLGLLKFRLTMLLEHPQHPALRASSIERPEGEKAPL